MEGDIEFETLKQMSLGVQINISAQNKHVPHVERYICTVQDCARSCYHKLLFTNMPQAMIIWMISNCIFWQNVFLHPDGVSKNLSPCYLLTGRHLDYTKHAQLEYSGYVQTHKMHNNTTEAHTIGAVCLGPFGNNQGGLISYC